MPDVVRGARGLQDGEGTPFAAYRFKNREVFTPSGQSGRVLSVMAADDGRYHAIIDFGSNLGRHQVPIADIAYEGNRFVVHNADVRTLPSFTEGQKGLRMVDSSTAINIPGYRLVTDMDDESLW